MGWTLDDVRALTTHEYEALVDKLNDDAKRTERQARRR